MKQERFEQANELLSEYCKEKEINSLIKQVDEKTRSKTSINELLRS